MPHGQLQAARQHAADEYIAYPQMGKSVAPGNFYQTICAIIFPDYSAAIIRWHFHHGPKENRSRFAQVLQQAG